MSWGKAGVRVLGVETAGEVVFVNDRVMDALLTGYAPGRSKVYHLGGPGSWRHLGRAGTSTVDRAVAEGFGLKMCDRCERRQHSIRRARAVRS